MTYAALFQKPLRRIAIEEVGVDDPKETQMFHKRLEMETQNVVRRDLDTFDAKFASGDAAICCSTVSDAKPETSRSSSCTAVKESDVDKDQGRERQMNTLLDGAVSGRSTAGSVATLHSVFAVPSGSFQFQADWKRLGNRPEEFYMYFKVTAISCLLCLSVAVL